MIVRIFFRRLHTRWDVMSPTSSTCNETQTKKYQRMNVIVKPLSISHYVSRYLVVCRRHWSVMKDGQYMKINVKLLLRCYLLVVLIVCRARYWPSVTVNILHCKLMLIDHRICCWQRKRHERCISKMIHYCRYTKSPATHSRRKLVSDIVGYIQLQPRVGK